MHTDILIVGGGLSGLALAAMLTQADRDFQLVEARERLGGRILTQQSDGAALDLGPAWFWPGQPRIARLIADLGLAFFEQHAAGALTFEDEQGHVQRGRGYASMQGSLRIDGGIGALIDALASRVPTDRIHMSTPIRTLTRTDTHITASTTKGDTFTAQQIVLALPPRLASNITFSPAIPSEARTAMESVPTWMAGQAKAVAVYDSPFWRDAGLSGDAMSRRGPMVEIHDASPNAANGPGALFGFIGVPPAARQDAAALENAIKAQLARLFGDQAGRPRSLSIKDWGFDPMTSTPLDLQPLHAHPRYGLPPALHDLWGNGMIFSGTETAPQFGGYLEGALEAAEMAMTQCANRKVEDHAN